MDALHAHLCAPRHLCVDNPGPLRTFHLPGRVVHLPAKGGIAVFSLAGLHGTLARAHSCLARYRAVRGLLPPHRTAPARRIRVCIPTSSAPLPLPRQRRVPLVAGPPLLLWFMRTRYILLVLEPLVPRLLLCGAHVPRVSHTRTTPHHRWFFSSRHRSVTRLRLVTRLRGTAWFAHKSGHYRRILARSPARRWTFATLVMDISAAFTGRVPAHSPAHHHRRAPHWFLARSFAQRFRGLDIFCPLWDLPLFAHAFAPPYRIPFSPLPRAPRFHRRILRAPPSLPSPLRNYRLTTATAHLVYRFRPRAYSLQLRVYLAFRLLC